MSAHPQCIAAQLYEGIKSSSEWARGLGAIMRETEAGVFHQQDVRRG